MNIIAVVIARGGSKDIPNKNLALLGGLPLVSHIIKSAVKAAETMNFEIILSTDSEEIRKTGIQAGAWAPFLRPRELAGDNVTSLPVVQHAVGDAEKIRGKKYDIIIYMQPTTPLCRPADIEESLKKLMADEKAESVVTVTEAETHPFRMKRIVDGERVINYIDQGFEDMRPRQSLPKVYKRAGSVYASRRAVVMEKGALVGEPCLGVIVPEETAVDVNREVDLKLAELFYLKRNKS